MTQAGLTSAFPAAMVSEVAAIESTLSLTGPSTVPAIEVKLGGESLSIPYRVYYTDNKSEMASLGERERLIYSCIFTRHHNGYVRQWHLEQILSSREAWVAPFIFQLMGEYVKEILDVIDARKSDILHSAFLAFLRENPRHFEATFSRMASYWDRYHRTRLSRKQDFVGFRLFKLLRCALRTEAQDQPASRR